MRYLTDYLMYAIVFTSMTIPRAGDKIGMVPITLPIVLYFLLLALWALSIPRIKFKLRSGDTLKDLGTYAMLVFLAVGLAALAIGMMRGSDATDILVEGAALVGFVPMFFLTRAHIRDGRAFSGIIRLVTISLTLACIYGVIQRIFGPNVVMIPGITICYADAMNPDALALKMNMTAIGLKTVSTFQNGNLFGNYLALLIPIPAALYYGARGIRKLPYLMILLLAIGTLLLTLSRGAIVAGIVSLGVLSLLLRRATGLRAASVMLFFVGGILVYVLQLGERLFNFDPTMAGRVPAYHNMVNVYESLPPLTFLLTTIVGVGMGGFVGAVGNSVPIIESSLLNVGIKMGLIGLISLFIAIFAAFMYAWRWCRPSATPEGYIGCALAAGMVGATVQMAIDGVIMLPPTAMNFWIVIALVFVAGSLVRANQPGVSVER